MVAEIPVERLYVDKINIYREDYSITSLNAICILYAPRRRNENISDKNMSTEMKCKNPEWNSQKSYI